MSLWLSDFKFVRGGIYVKATDTLVPVNLANTKDTLFWFTYYMCELTRSLPVRLKSPRAKIYAAPARPRAWYLLWAASWRAGYKFVKMPDDADIHMSFEDKTLVNRALPAGCINGECTDISKSKVASVFEQVFGYALAVEPTTYAGDMVVKSETNGTHDGTIVKGPVSPEDGMVYQRMIDTSDAGYVTDLRCPSAGGKIELIYIKRRPAERRFANMNSTCTLARPEDMLSDAERAKLSEFAKAMGLDWGGMDVLRDKTNGLIYVVDVNKTDMGPPIALPLKDKLRSVSILAKSLTQMIDAKLETAE